jgi:hypothetical protein
MASRSLKKTLTALKTNLISQADWRLFTVHEGKTPEQMKQKILAPWRTSNTSFDTRQRHQVSAVYRDSCKREAGCKDINGRDLNIRNYTPTTNLLKQKVKARSAWRLTLRQDALVSYIWTIALRRIFRDRYPSCKIPGKPPRWQFTTRTNRGNEQRRQFKLATEIAVLFTLVEPETTMNAISKSVVLLGNTLVRFAYDKRRGL